MINISDLHQRSKLIMNMKVGYSVLNRDGLPAFQLSFCVNVHYNLDNL